MICRNAVSGTILPDAACRDLRTASKPRRATFFNSIENTGF
jgi:hypothetical protein